MAMFSPASHAAKSEDDQASAGHRKFALVDIGYEQGEDFCRNLLETGDFLKPTLQALGARGHGKAELAADAAMRIVARSVSADRALLAFCKQPRSWLSVRTCSLNGAIQNANPPYEFLTNPRSTGWHGPVVDETAAWYVHVKRVPHLLVVEGAEPQPVVIRWHVVAEVTTRYAALHWNNFTRNDQQHPNSPVQFEYWKWVPGYFGTLANQVGARWTQSSPLHEIVLDRIWNQFVMSPEYTWMHRRVRAERDGVAVNARSGAVSDISVSGLRILTTELARTALVSLGLDEQNLSQVESALLRTLIHHWGTRSYEFSLDRGPEKLFRGHCYFGATKRSQGGDADDNDVDDEQDEGAPGPDGFTHVNCFAGYGNSRGALQFLLPYYLGK